MGDKKRTASSGLPTYCPSWCSEGLGGHRQALEEGATVEHAAQHMSTDLGEWPRTLIHPAGGKTIREGQGGWTARLVQDAKAAAHAFLWLELMITGGQHVSLNLTTGEARTLTAQLVALADAQNADLG